MRLKKLMATLIQNQHTIINFAFQPMIALSTRIIKYSVLPRETIRFPVGLKIILKQISMQIHRLVKSNRFHIGSISKHSCWRICRKYRSRLIFCRHRAIIIGKFTSFRTYQFVDSRQTKISPFIIHCRNNFNIPITFYLLGI